MAPASTATREAPVASPRANPASATAPRPAHDATHNTGRSIPARPSRTATDDEILGLDPATRSTGAAQPAADAANATSASKGADPWREDDASPSSPSPQDRQQDPAAAQDAEPEALRATLDANPELRRAWDDAQAYRETFATPEAARTATALLADLDRMDALFVSRRPEDHAELARAVANLDLAAFSSLAQAMAGLATEAQRHEDNRAGNRGLPSAPPISPVIPRSEATRNLSSDAATEIPRSSRDDSPKMRDSVSSRAAAPAAA